MQISPTTKMKTYRGIHFLRANENTLETNMILRWLRTIFLILFLVPTPMHAQDSNSPQRIKALLDEVKAALQRKGKSDPRDDLAVMQIMPEFHALNKETNTSWRVALENINGIAPSTGDQIILFAALEHLPAKEYVNALEIAVNLSAENRINKPILLNYFLFAGAVKWGFLEVNFKDPSVIRILQKVQAMDPSDSETLKSINYILSGQGRLTVEDNLKNNPDYMNHSIKALLIDNGKANASAVTPSSADLTLAQQTSPVGSPTPTYRSKTPSPGFSVSPVATVGALIAIVIALLFARKHL